jgi:DNA-binding MarR family transcriptional regulator
MSASDQVLVADVGAAMQQYQRSVQAFDDAVGRALGLNPTDLRCLDWLVDGPRTVGQLAEATGLRPAATTTMVDRLTTKGFVRRVPSDDDRRRVIVEMTDEGREQTWACYGPMVEEGQQLLATTSPEQLAWLRDLLVEIRTMTDRHREQLASRIAPA